MSTDRIEFFVPGIPRPQGSKTAFVNRKTGRPILVETSKHARPWRQEVACAAMQAVAEQGALAGDEFRVEMQFRFPRPKSHLNSAGLVRKGKPTRPRGKPDWDKLARLVSDALTHIAVTDDAEIVQGYAEKIYTRGVPGVHVVVTVAEPGELYA